MISKSHKEFQFYTNWKCISIIMLLAVSLMNSVNWISQGLTMVQISMRKTSRLHCFTCSSRIQWGWNCLIANCKRCRRQCKICRSIYSIALFFLKEQSWNIFNSFEKWRLFDWKRRGRKHCNGIIIGKQWNWCLQDYCCISTLISIKYCHMLHHWHI